MAWNRPNNGEAASLPRHGAKGASRLRGVIAAAVVVVGSVVVWWFFPGSDERPVKETGKTNGLIRAVQPVVVTNKVERQKKKDVIRWRGQEYPMYNEEGGKAYVTGYGVRYHSKVVITNKMSRKLVPWEYKQFKCPTDKRIAVLLNTEPGTQIIGGIPYDPNFTKQFKESLKTPIVIEPDDDEDAKALKEAVIETRKELQARMEKGEDIGQIVHDAQKELQDLGAYKKELEDQVRKIMSDRTMTEKDLDDCVGAANTMLESRGLPPMKVDEFYRQGIKLREKHMKGQKK